MPKDPQNDAKMDAKIDDVSILFVNGCFFESHRFTTGINGIWAIGEVHKDRTNELKRCHKDAPKYDDKMTFLFKLR